MGKDIQQRQSRALVIGCRRFAGSVAPDEDDSASSDRAGRIVETAVNRVSNPSSTKLRTRSMTALPRGATCTGSCT
jgi:hypothetical protein